MSFTQSTVNYSKIQEHIKGITFISRGSINFLKAAYDGKLEEAAKLLANYTWRTTRDTTMVLITAALLVLAEKNKETFKDELEKLKTEKTQIQNLFELMSQGGGKQAQGKAEALEGIFKSILKKYDKINDKKINEVWTGYLNQIGRITEWKYSKNTVYEYVYPVLQKTLKFQLFNCFAKGSDCWTPEATKKIHQKTIKQEDGSTLTYGATQQALDAAIKNIKNDVQKKLTDKGINVTDINNLHLGVDDDENIRTTYSKNFKGESVKWHQSNSEIRYWYFANWEDKPSGYDVRIQFSRIDCYRYAEKNLAKKNDDERVKEFEELFKQIINAIIPELKPQAVPSIIPAVLKDLKKELKCRRMIDLNEKVTENIVQEQPFKIAVTEYYIDLDAKSLIAHLGQNKLYSYENIKNEIKKYLEPYSSEKNKNSN